MWQANIYKAFPWGKVVENRRGPLVVLRLLFALLGRSQNPPQHLPAPQPSLSEKAITCVCQQQHRSGIASSRSARFRALEGIGPMSCRLETRHPFLRVLGRTHLRMHMFLNQNKQGQNWEIGLGPLSLVRPAKKKNIETSRLDRRFH